MTRDRLRLLIIGATGVFGSRLVERLAMEPGFDLVLAARDRTKLAALAARSAPDAVIRPLDRALLTADDLAGVDIVIDAAGPFQDSHKRVIEAAIAARVHYVDLADGRDFVTGIGQHDAQAKAAGIAVISGASSIPALSHAAIDQLTEGWQRIDTIKMGIFPGNRAPRGLSVVQAILTYAGKPLRVFRNGGWESVPGWGQTHRWSLPDGRARWASACDTPEQDLLVARYKPQRSAEFFAGLELPLLHLGLTALTLPVRWGVFGSLRPAARPLLRVAQWFLPFGSDVGWMDVLVSGIDASGAPMQRRWTFRATGNRGPFVPILPTVALLRRWRDDGLPAPGARPCSGLLDLADFTQDFDALAIKQWIS